MHEVGASRFALQSGNFSVALNTNEEGPAVKNRSGKMRVKEVARKEFGETQIITP